MASIPTQEEFLAATRKGQEAMVVAIKRWLETVRTTNHRLMSVYAPLTDRLPKLPPVRLPFADRLPAPEDAVAGAYDLAEQLLASQRRFAEDLVKATTPLMPRWAVAGPEGNGSSEPRIPARKAWEEAVAVSEAKQVAVTEPKPVAVTEPKPVAVTEPKPVAVTEPKPVAASAKKSAAAKGTGTPRGTGSARRSNTRSRSTGSAAKQDGASPAPKDAAAS
jgi:hypothetical protein